LLAALVGLVTLLMLWSNVASAQTITLGTPGRIRPAPSGEEQDPRNYDYRNTRPWWISYEDCISNEVLVFPLTVNNARSTVEVWAGNDTCDERRGSADRGQCWLVASETARRDMTINVPVRTVVEQDRSDLTISTNPGLGVCTNSTDEDGQQLTFFFFIEDGGKAVTGSVQRWTGGAQGTGFDLVGPNPPSDLSVLMGESQLMVSFANLEEDLQLERIGAYCVAAGTGVEADVFEPATATTDAGTPDAGSSTDDDTTDSATLTPAPQECFTPLLVGGARPDYARASELNVDLSCGTANKSSGEVRTKKLENGTTYAIAVAGEDLLGNPGVLSRIACGTPQELEDFFERYKANGGKGGGGFCAVSPGHIPVAPGAAALLGLVLAALGVRRARSRA
jgi:hypothetical protein